MHDFPERENCQKHSNTLDVVDTAECIYECNIYESIMRPKAVNV